MLGLALPSMSLFLIFNLVNLAVIKIVTTLGSAEVTAVTTGSQIFFIVYAGIMGLSAGATALIARAWGVQKPQEAALFTSLYAHETYSDQAHGIRDFKQYTHFAPKRFVQLWQGKTVRFLQSPQPGTELGLLIYSTIGKTQCHTLQSQRLMTFSG